MPWLEFSLEAPKEIAPIIEDFLLEHGAQAVTIQDLFDDAIFEPELGSTPLWPSNTVTGLFDTDINGELLFTQLQKRLGKQTPSNFKLQALEDRDWEREWLKHYKSMCFGEHSSGKRLWIVPSENLLECDDLPSEIKKEDIILKMDPGLAFGTGTHETTALCLEWLASNDLENKTLIDYGCGSGILAIAARLLGAKRVLGCDLDPQAILASEENARRNQILSEFEIYNVENFRHKTSTGFKADIVIANILAGPLEKLCAELATLLNSGGIIVLSGILAEQANSLESVYQEYFKDIKITAKNDWIRLVATKR